MTGAAVERRLPSSTMMRSSGATSRVILLAAALVATGCDPGYRYKPITWIAQPQRHWTRDFDGFSLRMTNLQGPVGQSWQSTTIEVIGTKGPVTLIAASLLAAGHTYVGVVASPSPNIVTGGCTLKVSWDFGDGNRALDVLGRRATMTLDLVVASRPQTVRIDVERAACCL